MLQHGIVLLMIGPLMPDIIASYGIDKAAAGLLLGIGSLGFMLGPVIAGAIIDRFGVRAAFVFGTAVEIAFLLLFGFSSQFWVATTANFFVQFGSAFIETGSNVLPTLVPTRKSAHAVMNFVHLFFSIGAFAGPLLIGLYLDSSGPWRSVFLLIITPTFALLVATLAILPRTAPASGVSRGGESSTAAYRAVLKNRATVFGAIALMFYVGAEIGISVWIVLYLQRVLGFSTIVSSAGLSVLWLSVMIGRYGNSMLGNRFSAAFLVAVSGVSGALGLVLLLNVSAAVPVFILLGLVGISLAGVFPNIMAEVNRRDPSRTGVVTAVMTTGAAGGAVLFQWLIGVVAELSSLRTAFYIPALLQLLVVAAFVIALSDKVMPGKAITT